MPAVRLFLLWALLIRCCRDRTCPVSFNIFLHLKFFHFVDSFEKVNLYAFMREFDASVTRFSAEMEPFLHFGQKMSASW